MNGRLSTMKSARRIVLTAAALLSILLLLFVTMRQVNAEGMPTGAGERLITVHDEDGDRGILTKATTLREAFRGAGIVIDPSDRVEPGLDDPLAASQYDVNIYRARPVTIVDGSVSVRVMSPYRTADQIAKQASITLQDEDVAKMEASTDIVGHGAGVRMEITRATEFTLNLYGKKMTAYSQGKTVGEMLEGKKVSLGPNDDVSVPLSTPLVKGMTVEVWRNGAQTVTEEQTIPFTTEKILAMDLPIGKREVKTSGQSGVRMVTYEIIIQDGKEISRKEIQNVVNKEPVKQVELVGNKSVNGLTKAKGAQIFTDSQGVSHRETYYDLPMNVVMRACGGGDYTIRSDGAKIDRDGYILVAANLSLYPRCSIVETSMGLGKVYDTGGFVVRHPTGYDLATDWTNNDGR
ncbi:G5 domain-containing protein [Streptomyces caniscabiei]|uniref:G5 domain-containing protein n=1 Tax=Streptomyces caniscabiei TaxID=2746961 RepID=UPI0029AB00DE|nr:G5 domain-containing protein [Streptomyces caniscabiei]MDX2776681.1 G5 domain-containing protein [Streptomyces caniscabiei]